jgi:hypothetical protein
MARLGAKTGGATAKLTKSYSLSFPRAIQPDVRFIGEAGKKRLSIAFKVRY